MATRLAVVSFLNTRPLVHALETGRIEHRFDLTYDVPSRCAERLHSGEADAALIPSVEIARGPVPYRVVPEVGISSRGPVRSVLLLHRKDPADIRTLALDVNSRTSSVLSRVLLQKRYRCRPDVLHLPPDAGRMLDRADAAVIIGDAALAVDTTSSRVIDMGEAWTALTGLPFVYACWAGRSDALDPEQTRQLIRSKTLGVGEIPHIAAICASSGQGTAGFYADFLGEKIRYDFGEAELAGLNLFFRYAHESGLIGYIPKIRFYAQA
ncbi:MAG: menaquinone biosynthesis protein [Gemmatimonadota bacterium]|nr:menaquinone biosynthesis protein [Gemmatimonadota bacterium]